MSRPKRCTQIRGIFFEQMKRAQKTSKVQNNGPGYFQPRRNADQTLQTIPITRRAINNLRRVRKFTQFW